VRIYNQYIITLTLVSGLINISLAFFGQNSLDIYFSINIIAFLVITLVHIFLNPRARKALNTIGAVLFVGFVVVVSLKVIEILYGR